MNFAVLLDDLGHFSIMSITSDNAILSDVLYRRHAVRFGVKLLALTAPVIYAPPHGFCCGYRSTDPDLVVSSANLDAAANSRHH